MPRAAATIAAFSLLVAALSAATLAPPAAAFAEGAPCATSGTWQQGELNVYWFDVEQGDAQLIVGPTGRTMLIDLGERSWNARASTMAMRVEAAIREICDVPTGPIHLDHVMASHHHLDHIGYAGNPNDTSSLGNGIYQLLHPDEIGWTVGTLIDRDGGTWVDVDGDGTCSVGTSAEPSDEVVFHNAGTTSQTARRWICWLHGPDGQRDRAHIEGRVEVLTNDLPSWPTYDLGPGVTAEVLQANAKDIMQADGVTPVAGDHTAADYPPSENDYSIAIRFGFGDYRYATAGDTDGVYGTSAFGYSYNDVEAELAPRIGVVDTMRVNHQGSGHSSSDLYVETLAPETAIISCGNNSYGHPANRVLDVLRNVPNSLGTGADIYLTNNPCDDDERDGTPIDYSGTFNTDGDIWLHTTGGGSGYLVHYDAGTNEYVAGLPPVGDPGDEGEVTTPVTITEVRFRGPGGAGDEFVEIRNVSSEALDVSGWRLQGCAATSGAPSNRATIPSDTTLQPGMSWLFAHTGYTGSVAPDQTYGSGIADGGGARIVDAAGLMVDGVASDALDSNECREGTGLPFPTTNDDVSFHRLGDGATDTDDNLADFEGPSPSSPVNSSGHGTG
jgi:beta-lactamase superfamily II metal-dependent hydrolase